MTASLVQLVGLVLLIAALGLACGLLLGPVVGLATPGLCLFGLGLYMEQEAE